MLSIDNLLNLTIDSLLGMANSGGSEAQNPSTAVTATQEEQSTQLKKELSEKQISPNRNIELEEESKSAEKIKSDQKSATIKEQASVKPTEGAKKSEAEEILSKEEEEKRTRELIDQLLAQEMQDQFEQEDAQIIYART